MVQLAHAIYNRPPYNKSISAAGLLLEDLLKFMFEASKRKFLPIESFDRFIEKTEEDPYIIELN